MASTTSTTTRRPSRASRGAAASGAKGQLNELIADGVPSPSAMAEQAKANSTGQSAHGRSATGDNGHGHQPGKGNGGGKPAGAAGKPDADKPKGEIEIQPTPVTYYKPVVSLADGTRIECEHRYLHETEKMAAACGRKMLAAGKFAK